MHKGAIEVKVKIKKTNPNAIVPRYATDGAACFDLHACFADRGEEIRVTGMSVIDTGLAFEVPQGHVMLVFSRSGHAMRSSVSLANSVGVIDSDYRGEVKVMLIRVLPHMETLVVRHGDRIAQAMIVPYPRVEFDEVKDLADSARGDGGFGSTGA